MVMENLCSSQPPFLSFYDFLRNEALAKFPRMWLVQDLVVKILEQIYHFHRDVKVIHGDLHFKNIFVCNT